MKIVFECVYMNEMEINNVVTEIQNDLLGNNPKQ